MKNLILFLLLFISLPLSAQVSFTKGVNLTGWFQASSPKQIQFTKYSKRDFERIKSLGCDVIRLPINLHAMTNGSPDHTLDPLFLELLDQAVMWAEELQINLILDNHTFDPAASTDPAIGTVLVKVWTQMAEHYKNRSGFIYYEVLNEPHGISDSLWGSIQQTVIDAIRLVDNAHYIVVGGAGWNSYNNLGNIPVYADSKLIYTFHFYDPFVFTHQGASWTDPSMVPLSGVPFPYNASVMPDTPASLKGTWIEGAINAYSTEGNVAKVKSLIDIAVNFSNARKVPVFCGEFGVYIPNSSNTDRVYWYDVVRKYLEEKNIPWTTWDYQGSFGLFKKDSNELFDYDLNTGLLGALGMTVPPQLPYIKRPKTSGFVLYDDFIGEGIVDASFPGTGILDYYNNDTPVEGTSCIYWSDVPQYNAIALDFKPDIDLSLLKSNDHVLEFWVKGNTPGTKFDIRFIDTKTSPSDRPWRMGKTIDNTFAVWDGTWQKITMALKDLEEKGAWDNAFFSPEEKFDWKAIDRFEIVAEHQALNGIKFWFDDLRISGDEVLYEDPVTAIEENASADFQVYPNPVEQHAVIQFALNEGGPTSIKIYSSQGQLVRKLIDGNIAAGDHAVAWEGDYDNRLTVPPGFYMVELRTRNRIVVMKLLKLF